MAGAAYLAGLSCGVRTSPRDEPRGAVAGGAPLPADRLRERAQELMQRWSTRWRRRRPDRRSLMDPLRAWLPGPAEAAARGPPTKLGGGVSFAARVTPLSIRRSPAARGSAELRRRATRTMPSPLPIRPRRSALARPWPVPGRGSASRISAAPARFRWRRFRRSARPSAWRSLAAGQLGGRPVIWRGESCAFPARTQRRHRRRRGRGRWRSGSWHSWSVSLCIPGLKGAGRIVVGVG